MMVRLGIPGSFQRFGAVARDLGAPILVSANALRRARRPGFSAPRPTTFAGLDTALDGAGFVAMMLYGGYPWSTADYVRLVASGPWSWWAAMDLCCEPEIARDRATVLQRVEGTVANLARCREEAERQGVRPPMPVLQGWRGGDYLRCAELIGQLPDLVGLGSVCRRQLGGPAGLMMIVDQLDAALDRHVRLHLFGVKGSAIAALRGHPRIASVDSMGWDYAARRERAEGQSCTVDYRAGHMRRWYRAQTEALSRPGIAHQHQLQLEGAA